MKLLTLLFLICIVYGGTAQSHWTDDEQKMNNPYGRIRTVGEYLREEIVVLPGEQLYKAQDMWKNSGSKNIVVTENNNAKSKIFEKDVMIKDAGQIVEGYHTFKYTTRNETIVSVVFTVTLEKGDAVIDKLISLEGQYEPAIETRKNVVFSGTYYFDDFYVKVTEFQKEEKMDFTVTKNPNPAIKDRRRQSPLK